MTLHRSLPVALLSCAGLLVLAPPEVLAQMRRAPGNTSLVRAPIGDVGMAGANAPRAGSITRGDTGPGYQQPPAEPMQRSSSPRQSSDNALNEEYFNPPAAGRGRGQSHATVNRAAYHETDLINDIANTEEIITPVGVPEDLPVPGATESIPMMDSMPYRPLRYRGGPAHYGAGPAHSADYGCDSGNCGGDCSGGCGDPLCAGDCGFCDSCPDWYPGKDLTVFVGTHAFSGASDAEQLGSFGFHEGVNWSAPFWNAAGIGFQLGFQAMQSDFQGGDFFDNDRSQYFITTGFFRRQMCEYGWQWGVVYDYLSDEFIDDFDVSQFRGELSYRFRGHELGFWFASNSSDDQPGPESTGGVTSFETVDMYAAFYRRRLMNGGEGRLWGGVTGESDGIFGGDVRVPLACDWDLVAAFNYLSPPDDDDGNQLSDAWNIGINLVWYVCPEGAIKACGSRYRPLFGVADNGTLVTSVVR